MKLVVIESPFVHLKDDPEDGARKLAYLRAALRDCLLRGEAPFASHAIYTQEGVLDDWIKDQRKLGIDAGFAWGRVGQLRAVYTDLGISSGMQSGIDEAKAIGQEVEYRTLAGWV